MNSYALALETIRRSKVPTEIVKMHLKYSLTEGAVCGDCSAYSLPTPGRVPYCLRCYSVTKLAPETVACGRFTPREKREMTSGAEQRTLEGVIELQPAQLTLEADRA